MVGAKLVLPGARLDGASLYALFEAEGVSSTAGVPTVWLGLLDWMDGHAKEFTSLKRVIIGGSAVPAIMISRFHHKGGEVRQAWGMRSEERRVGKEGFRTCRFRWSALP